MKQHFSIRKEQTVEPEYEARREELLAECQVAPQIFQRVLPRLETFLQPFVQALARREQVQHAHTFVQGLLSDVDRKNVESIAYRFGQDRLPLQHFIGASPWDDQPLRDELVHQVGAALGEPDGVIVFDPSAFPKSGGDSAGVARQWCNRLGKVDNCQVAVYMAYVSGREHALVDTRLFLPREWTGDKARCEKAGIPREVRFRTRHQLCLEMLERHGPHLPHAWITGDDELGRPYWFRRRLHRRKEQYLLAIPSNLLIRDQEADPPSSRGRGPHPRRPWTPVARWAAMQDAAAWTEVDVRDGAKGPLVVEVLVRQVVARTPRRQEGHAEILVVVRYRDRDRGEVVHLDYYLSNASADTSCAEFARVAKAEHRVEECLQRSKSEAGLGDYEVRTWRGWHHHQTLSLIATWFLVQEARRGKKMDARDHAAANPGGDFVDPSPRVRLRDAGSDPARASATPDPQRTRSPVSLAAA
jgi:SRSO17 transposase